MSPTLKQKDQAHSQLWASSAIHLLPANILIALVSMGIDKREWHTQTNETENWSAKRETIWVVIDYADYVTHDQSDRLFTGEVSTVA